MSAENESRASLVFFPFLDVLLAAVGSPGLCLFRRGLAHQWPGEDSSPAALYQSPRAAERSGSAGQGRMPGL